MSGPAVSVVVPFFRSARWVERSVESLLRARDALGEPVQLLFVDNTAAPDDADGSAEIVARYAGAEKEMTLLREPTPGAYAARNAALRVAEAPIFAFTDADCAVDAGWLRAVVDGLADPQTALLLGEVRYPADASLPLRLLGAYENAKTRHVLESCPPAHRFAYANNMAVRASLFDDVGPFREWRRAGDTEWLHRLAARRPELRVSYAPSMRVTHLEFTSFRARARRLSHYTETNSKILSFRELSPWQRLRVLGRLVTSR